MLESKNPGFLPVSALSFLPHGIVAVGSGNSLKVTCVKTGRDLASFSFEDPMRIHGIEIANHSYENEENLSPQTEGYSSYCIIVWGLKRVRIMNILVKRKDCYMTCDIQFSRHNRALPKDLNDRAVAVSLFEDSFLMVVLAHNFVQLYDLKREPGQSLVRTARCCQRCILYSADIYVSECSGPDDNVFSRIVVASGTVFNQVLLWFPFSASFYENGDLPVSARLVGHEGVIFSIDTHTQRYGLEKGCWWISTTSDDRTVRVWKITCGSIVPAMVTESAAEQNRDCGGICIREHAVLWGHTARVWDSRVIEVRRGEGQGGEFYVASVGEDTCCKLWKVDVGRGELSGLLTTFSGHYRRSVWSMGLCENPLMLGTGGADCSVRLWMINFILDRDFDASMGNESEILESSYCIPKDMLKLEDNEESTLDAEDSKRRKVACVNKDGASKSHSLKLYPRNVSLVKRSVPESDCGDNITDTVTVSSSGGVYFCRSWEGNAKKSEWYLISYDKAFLSYSTMSYLKNKQLLLVGDADGYVTLIDMQFKIDSIKNINPNMIEYTGDDNIHNVNSGNVKWKCHIKKIQHIMPCEEPLLKDGSSNDAFWFFTSGVQDCLRCWRIDISYNEGGDGCRKFSVYCMGALELPMNAWIQAACFGPEATVVSGDRNGNLYLHKLKMEGNYCVCNGVYSATSAHLISDTLQNSLSPLCRVEQCINRVHGKNGVTDLKVLRRKGHVEDHRNYTILSCGRDGYLNYYKVLSSSCGEVKIELTAHEKASKKIDWLSKIVIVNSNSQMSNEEEAPACPLFENSEIILIGFFTVHFVVWNVTKNKLVFPEIDCGGGYRDWDFQISKEDSIERIKKSSASAKSNGTECKFVYIRQGALYILNVRNKSVVPKGFRSDILYNPFHGREVHDVRFLAFSKLFPRLGEPYRHRNSSIVLTASEDSRVLANVVSHESQLTHEYSERLLCIDGHTSSVRTMDYVVTSQATDNAGLTGAEVILFTAGGKEIIQCWSLTLSRNIERVSSVASGISALYSLVSRWKCNMKTKEEESAILGCEFPLNNVESRIMSLSTLQLSSDTFLLLVGSSEALVKLYAFCRSSRKYSLIALSDFHQKCVLNVKLLMNGDLTSEFNIIGFTSATDGKVLVWNMSAPVKSYLSSLEMDTPLPRPANLRMPIHEFQGHQSGVNTFAVQAVSRISANDSDSCVPYVMISGGDDNAVSLWTFDMKNVANSGVSLENSHSIVNQNGHGSSVTCSAFLSEARDGATWFVTSGADQRVQIWKGTVTEEKVPSMTLYSSFFTDVADVACLDAIPVEDGANSGLMYDIVISGMGMQTIRWSEPT